MTRQNSTFMSANAAVPIFAAWMRASIVSHLAAIWWEDKRVIRISVAMQRVNFSTPCCHLSAARSSKTPVMTISQICTKSSRDKHDGRSLGKENMYTH